MPTKNQKTTRNIIIGLFAFFLFTRKGNSKNNYTTAYANFENWVKPGTRRYRRIEGGYTLLPNWDNGHWTGGQVGVGTKAGTNMSIAAFTYERWMRENFDPTYQLTEQKMRDMPREHALRIYKEQFWDKIQGDFIKSQLIANFVADMKSSGGGVKNFQRALNNIGTYPPLALDGYFGTLTLAATNKLLEEGKECELNNEFRKTQIDYYLSLTNQASNWYTSLDVDYPELIC